MTKYNDKIFLSHHSSKKDLVEHLAKYLLKNGIETWFAPRDIPSGTVWDEEIHNAIKGCKAVVLLFCAQADQSPQVKREITLADKYKKPILWIRVERVEPDKLGYFLTSTQWFDWIDARDETLEKLVDDINAIEQCVIPEETDLEEIQETGIKSPGDGSWAKGVFAFSTDREASECAARVYFQKAQESPDSSVVLPTGRSATLIFRSMLRVAKEYEGCPFGEAHLISDTETFGVWEGHETSRTRHIKEMLIEPLALQNKEPDEFQMHLLSGVYMKDDPIKTAQKVLRLYQPAVHGVSVSPVGEILAYEVGTYNSAEEIIDDGPRVVEVGEHSKKYIDPDQPSKSILTIGLGTALSAEILLILAFDLQKANIVKRLFNGTITAGIPATLLKKHTNVFVITTEKVAMEAGISEFVSEIKSAKEAAQWIVAQ